MHQDCAALPSTAGIYAQQNELQSDEDKPNIFHQSRENMQTISIYLWISVRKHRTGNIVFMLNKNF